MAHILCKKRHLDNFTVILVVNCIFNVNAISVISTSKSCINEIIKFSCIPAVNNLLQ